MSRAEPARGSWRARAVASVALGVLAVAGLGTSCSSSAPSEKFVGDWSAVQIEGESNRNSAIPLGYPFEIVLHVSQYREKCRLDSYGEPECETQEWRHPIELVTVECAGLATEIEVTAITWNDHLQVVTTSSEAGTCELRIVVRTTDTDEVLESSMTLAFSAPVRLGLEYNAVAEDPAPRYPLLVGAAFTLRARAYGAVLFDDFGTGYRLNYPDEDWEVVLDGTAFSCGCLTAVQPCQVGMEPFQGLSVVTLHAVEPGISTLTVRIDGLERSVQLEAVDESAVVGLELYVDPEGRDWWGVDVADDPLAAFERVTELQLWESGTPPQRKLVASYLRLLDGRPASGGAGAYRSPNAHLYTGAGTNSACPEAPLQTLAWMNLEALFAGETTLSAQIGTATATFPVSVVAEPSGL